jgi:hypothetical protein
MTQNICDLLGLNQQKNKTLTFSQITLATPLCGAVTVFEIGVEMILVSEKGVGMMAGVESER